MAEVPDSFSHDGSAYDTSSHGATAPYFSSYSVSDTSPRVYSGEVTPTDSYVDDYSSAGLRLISQEGVYQLTQDLRNFSDTLTSLKAVFCEERESLHQSLRVVAHERLGELLKVLKSTVNKYEELDSTGILNAAENLINHIKNFNYECGRETVPPEIFGAINSLALAFSSSVSECLIGDINISPRHSLDIHSQGGIRGSENEQISVVSQRSDLDDTHPDELLSPNYLEGGDSRIPRAESTANLHESVAKSLELTFDRAKTWSKYANDLLNFIKKKSHIELEYAKQLTKLSQTTRTVLSEQSFLPFQSLYCTLFDNDKEYASNLSTLYQNHLLAQKFFDPLNAARQEHDRARKILRESWRKEKRRLEEAESNLRKAKQIYHTRHQEYQKAKDAKLKADQQHSDKSLAEGSHSRQASGNSNQLAPAGSTLGLIGSGTSKIEKKRKHEDDSYNKAISAEKYYRACVHDTEQRRRDLDRREVELLERLKSLLTQSDQVTKRVTVNFFQAYCDLTSPIKVQYEALMDESKIYEPGSQYAEYLRHLVPQQTEVVVADSQFGSYRSDRDGFNAVPGGVGTDTESSSSRSVGDPSPAPSPANHSNRKAANMRRASTEGSLSSDEILDDGKDPTDSSRGKMSSLKVSDPSSASYTESSSPGNARPQFPQVPKMFKMVEQMKGKFKGMKKMSKTTIFGVDFSTVVHDTDDGIPMLIKKCVAEIDNRGIAVKGIYRVNGVKNRIEKICSMLNSPHSVRVDLTEQSPHDISGVLKFFLRQLPEPLVPYHFYEHFLEVAKEYSEITRAHRLRSPDEGKTADELDQDLFKSLRPCLDKMRVNVEMLPAAHNRTLHYITAHLSRVAQHQADNKMTASNLAIIFGPTLLRPRPSTESGQELLPLLELPNQSQAIDMLVTYHREIFLMPLQKVEPEELKPRFRGTQTVSTEVTAASDSDDYRDHFSRSRSNPSPYHRSSEFLSTERSSPIPETASTDIDTTLTSDSQQITSSRSSLTSNNDANSPRQDAYMEGNPRTDLHNDASYIANERRTIIPHRTSVTKNPSAHGSMEGLKKAGKPGRYTQDVEKKDNSDDFHDAKSTSYFSTRRSSIKNLPFFRASFDSIRSSDESQSSLCKTSEVQINNKRIQRSMSVDVPLDDAVMSHRPRSQRIDVTPALSMIHRIRKPAQSGFIEPMAVGRFEGTDECNNDRGTEKIEHKEQKSTQISGNPTAPVKHGKKLQTMPGRTPPMNKTVSLSLSKEQFPSLEPDGVSKTKASDMREKIRLDMGDSNDDSFC